MSGRCVLGTQNAGSWKSLDPCRESSQHGRSRCRFLPFVFRSERGPRRISAGVRKSQLAFPKAETTFRRGYAWLSWISARHSMCYLHIQLPLALRRTGKPTRLRHCFQVSWRMPIRNREFLQAATGSPKDWLLRRLQIQWKRWRHLVLQARNAPEFTPNANWNKQSHTDRREEHDHIAAGATRQPPAARIQRNSYRYPRFHRFPTMADSSDHHSTRQTLRRTKE